MNEYNAVMFGAEPKWDEVPEWELKNYLWEGENPYRPKTTVQLCAVDGKGFYLRLRSEEQPFRATYTKRDEPVWNDSCLEFFFLPFYVDDRYLNFEINPNGACLSAIGKGRENRVPISRITDARCAATPIDVEGGWGAELFIPQRLIAICYGISFETEMCKSIEANVYKCADLSEHPHFQSLFYVDTPTPDFHRPEFFGRINFIDERTHKNDIQSV